MTRIALISLIALGVMMLPGCAAHKLDQRPTWERGVSIDGRNLVCLPPDQAAKVQEILKDGND